MTGESRLLFVHQTKFQTRLLDHYGNSICLLNATYKTTKYSLPLFFVVVKTNVDYQVVSSFVVQDERRAAITEALRIIKKKKIQSGIQNASWWTTAMEKSNQLEISFHVSIFTLRE